MRVLAITAMYPTPDNPAYGAFVRSQVETLRQAGIEMDVLVLQGRNRKLIYAKGIVQLRQRLSQKSYDLVHAHYSYAGVVARSQWRVPVVVSYCGDDLLGSIGSRGQQTYSGKLAAMVGKALSYTVDTVIVKSQEMAQKLRRKDVYVIPNEVDFELFHPVEKSQARDILGLDPNKQYLLFAANPKEIRKGFAIAEKVAAELHQSDPAVEILVVYKEPQDRLMLYMNASDVLLFPSYQEGSPNIIKQAMACNLPIVATDVGDIREIIGNTSGCFVCEPSALAFTEKVSVILQTGQRTRGREEIRHLERPAIARRIIQVYEETLQKSQAPRKVTRALRK